MGVTSIKEYIYPEYDIQIPDLAPALEGFSVVHISDLHFDTGARIQKHLGSIIARLKARMAQIDQGIVVLTGDFVSGTDPENDLANLRASLDQIVALPLDKYAVLGNHDHYSPETDEISEILSEYGINQLDTPCGEHSITVKGMTIKILGTPDFIGEREHYESGVVQEFVKKSTTADLNILLTHSAEGVEPILADLKNTACFSGHTHGGQINLPIVRALALRYIGYRSRLIGGLYNINDSVVACVSRGLGGSKNFPVRINCPAEVPIVTFRKK